jgi:glucosamine-6-phosphate deaminase
MNTPTRPNAAPSRIAKVGLLAVRVHESSSDMAADAAALARQHLCDALKTRATARVIFACATSQIQFLAALAAQPGIDWSRVTVFHMDEYLGIGADHPASFRRFLREHLVQRVHPGCVHYLKGDALEPIAEALRYADILQESPIDVCCLGVGENGHIAFNDPAVANFTDPLQVKMVKLDEISRQQQVGEGCFPNLESVPQYALTLTIPALCAARQMICIVPERRKAQAIRMALGGPVTTACPASFLRQQSHATLCLDAEAASEVDWSAV